MGGIGTRRRFLNFASGKWQPLELHTREEVLALFNRTTAATRAAIAEVSDEALLQSWSLRNGEQIYFTLPRIAVLRSFFFNHLIHHRAQLGMYLRLNDIPLPPLYGPTADERM